jgi:hypothetical protein
LDPNQVRYQAAPITDIAALGQRGGILQLSRYSVKPFFALFNRLPII